MGIIIKQSIKGTIYAYIGALLGFVNVVVLMPKILLTGEIGLINILIALSSVFAQFSSLGYNSVTVRLFSYFRNRQNNHNGFFGITLLVTLIGFILSLVGFFVLKPYLIASNAEKSPLLVQNIYWLIPLIFFTLYYTIFDNFLKVLYNSTAGTLYKEIVFRILVLADLLLIQYKLVDFDLFLTIYCVGMGMPIILMLIDLAKQNALKLSLPKNFISPEFRRQIIKVALFGLIGGGGTILTNNIDKYLVGTILDLESTGVYSIAFFIGTLIMKPSISILKISSTVLADAWKNNDRKTISRIYQESCRDMLLVALFLLIGVWINRENLFTFLPKEYADGMYVVLFVGLASLVEMTSGTGGMVIQTSAYFPLITYTRLVTGLILILFNILLIPHFGILGSAMALLISRFCLAAFKILIVWIKFKMPAFGWDSLKILLISLFAFGLAEVLPQLGNIYIDFFIRSSLFTVCFVVLIYYLKVSGNFTAVINRSLNLIGLGNTSRKKKP